MFENTWTYHLIAIIIALIIVFVSWIKWKLQYWDKRGLICPKPIFLCGNIQSLLTQSESFGEFTINLYKYHKHNHNEVHGGFYMMFAPIYMPLDPEIVKSIMQTDFNHFIDRGMYYNEENDPISAHLFSLEGQKWRNLRAKLTPTFTSGKMKMMFETLIKCGDQLEIEMNHLLGRGPVDIKDILVRFTTDIIGNCAFGIECNSLKNPDNEFTKNMTKFFSESFWDNIINFITLVAPNFTKMLGVRAVAKSISDFFMNIVRDTVDYREKNNIYRKDFMHLLLQLKNRGKLSEDMSILKSENDRDNETSLTLNEIAAQAFVFFIAGFETSSTTMSFCLFELASNLDVQEKLRTEIIQVLKKHDNKLTYDAIMEMSFMDKVINETLRKYPPLPVLFRICTKEYKVPGTNLIIEKDTKVLIPVMGLQHDEEYYPNPSKFDPDRFSDENKNARHPYTFIPFGEGPRICIGLRFGMMQTKVGLAVLLKNFRFSLSSKTVSPLKFDPKSFILATKGGIWLDHEKI